MSMLSISTVKLEGVADANYGSEGRQNLGFATVKAKTYGCWLSVSFGQFLRLSRA
jgi:hypothetical protein